MSEPIELVDVNDPERGVVPLLQAIFKAPKPEYVYVASSWRCPIQPAVIAALKSVGIDHYDFRNPPNGAGFGWEQVGGTGPVCRCDHTRGPHGFCAAHGEAEFYRPVTPFDRTCNCPKDTRQSVETYLSMIEHPRALDGFAADFAAMEKADTFVLVLPCNRSAHLELGWAVSQGKRTAVLLEDPMEPELMYRMVDYLAPSLFDLLGWLGVED